MCLLSSTICASLTEIPVITLQAKPLPDTISQILTTAHHNNQWFLEVLGS